MLSVARRMMSDAPVRACERAGRPAAPGGGGGRARSTQSSDVFATPIKIATKKVDVVEPI